MNKTALALAAAAALAAATPAVFAQSGGADSAPSGLYLRGDLGLALGESTTFKDTNPGAANASLGTGSVVVPGNRSTVADIYFDGGLGYRFSPMFRTDFTLGYLPSEKGSGTIAGGPRAGFGGSSSADALLGLMNGYIDLNGVMPGTFDPLRPYLTGGIGFADYTVGTFSGSGGSLSGASRTNFAWGVGAGVAYPLGDQWALDLGYKYVDLGPAQTGTTAKNLAGVSGTLTAAKSGDIDAHLITLGLRWSFAAPPAPPPVAPTPVVSAPPAPPPAVMVAAQQMFIVFFEFDKSALTPDGRKVVAAAAAAFKAGKSSVAIAGYTDLAGTVPYNLALSKRRADTVEAALVKDGVPAAAIDESWHGKENPRVPTADGVREPQNRRVEIAM